MDSLKVASLGEYKFDFTIDYRSYDNCISRIQNNEHKER